MDKEVYNILFKEYDNCKNFIEKGETKIGEIIKKYLTKIEKSNLLENNISNICFIYNAIIIEPKDYDKTICNYFDINISADINSDYDVDRLADRIKKQIYDDASYRNVNAISYIR
mgnify:CR=1 FL=1